MTLLIALLRQSFTEASAETPGLFCLSSFQQTVVRFCRHSLLRKLSAPYQELQDSIEQPALLRAHSGLFFAKCSYSGCSS